MKDFLFSLVFLLALIVIVFWAVMRLLVSIRDFLYAHGFARWLALVLIVGGGIGISIIYLLWNH